MAFFGLRHIEEELEARLEPVTGRPEGSGARGKIERKRYRGGAERLKFKCRGIGLADGTPVTLLIAGCVVGQLTIAGGRARLDIEDTAPGTVPNVSAGDFAELCVDGKAIISGGFQHD